jgi:hypothetical protein
MAALVGYQADLYMASGASVTFTNEVMTDSGDHKTYNVAVGNTAHRYWDDTQALTIQTSPDGTTWTTVTTGFTVRYVGGQVTFTTADATRQVRASGKYLAISQVGSAYDWELSPTANIMDITTFGNAWKQKISGMKDATAKASKYFIDGTFAALLGSRFVVIFYINQVAGTRFEAFAWLKSRPTKVGVDAVIDEELDFEIDGQCYFQAS